jgi:hypothetical protein
MWRCINKLTQLGLSKKKRTTPTYIPNTRITRNIVKNQSFFLLKKLNIKAIWIFDTEKF